MGPSGTPTTTPTPGLRAAPGPRPVPAGRTPWGWLEWMMLLQTFIPALLFVPGLGPVRIVTRIATYVVPLVAWFFVARSGRRGVSAETFPARPWLLFCAGWLALEVLNPTTNSLISGIAHAALYITVFSPVFWAATALRSNRQIGRVMAILFLCNAASALVGIAQVYRPETFNPPEIPMLDKAAWVRDAMTIVADDGSTFTRPCGLTDSPGSASGAGETAAIIGLCWALAPIATWKRLTALVLAIAGVAVIYVSQVRSLIVVIALCTVGLVGLFAAQRNYRRAALLGVGAALILGASLAWALAFAGGAVGERFKSLIAGDPAEMYHSNRGHFLQETYERHIVDYPLGAGLGRWGMVNQYFGDHNVGSDRGALWVEIMFTAWVFDGGAPLLIAYCAAVALAVADSVRIALRCKDKEIAFWAAVVAASNVSIAALCFSYVPFLSPFGPQFWALAAAIHAADRRVRLGLEAPRWPGRAR